jgi:hypothetical protein
MKESECAAIALLRGDVLAQAAGHSVTDRVQGAASPWPCCALAALKPLDVELIKLL